MMPITEREVKTIVSLLTTDSAKNKNVALSKVDRYVTDKRRWALLKKVEKWFPHCSLWEIASSNTRCYGCCSNILIKRGILKCIEKDSGRDIISSNSFPCRFYNGQNQGAETKNFHYALADRAESETL